MSSISSQRGYYLLLNLLAVQPSAWASITFNPWSKTISVGGGKHSFSRNLDLDVSPNSIPDTREQKAVNFNPNYHHRNIRLGSI